MARLWRRDFFWLAVLFVAAAALAVVMVGGREKTPLVPAAETEDRPRGNEVRFAEGAPQLSYIRMEAVVAEAESLVEPLTGRLAYDESRTARIASPVAGRVIRILAEPGDRVGAGTVLVEIDAPDYSQAVADVEKARADLNQKQSAHQRVSELVEAGVSPRKDLVAAEADLKQAAAENMRAMARLRNYSGNGAASARMALKAHLGGVITERRVNPGSEVRPDQADPLFVITDPSYLWVMVDLPERLLGMLKRGQRVNVEVDAYPQTQFPAIVASIGEVVDPATRRVQVRCTIENRERKLKPEMYARVSLLAEESRLLPKVPNAALITEGLYAHVFVEISPGVFVKRRVQPALQGRSHTFIREGLQPGERIVTSGALLLNAELSGS
jgi:cobalt-zinc-cadmium efflux system membrane fusion protein